MPEREGAWHLLLLWADDGFSGADFSNWVDEHCGCLVEIVKLPDYAKGFVILPRRWLVEHTLGWLSGFRRLSKDYQRLAESSQTWIYAAMIGIMLHHLSKSHAVYC